MPKYIAFETQLIFVNHSLLSKNAKKFEDSKMITRFC